MEGDTGNKNGSKGKFKEGEVMGYPKEVREQIEILDKYQVDDTLKAFDIFHLYPGELAYPDGYQDSRFFNLVGFNTKTMKR